MDASPLRRPLLALATRQSLSGEQTAEEFGIPLGGEAIPAEIGGLGIDGGWRRASSGVGRVGGELGTRPVMTLGGPFANPAGVNRQVIGVAEADRAAIVAEALVRLGAEHALVVNGRVGMDEISPNGITDVWEVKHGSVRKWEIDPERFRLGIENVGELQGGEPAANAERLERILGGGNGSAGPAGLAAGL